MLSVPTRNTNLQSSNGVFRGQNDTDTNSVKLIIQHKTDERQSFVVTRRYKI